MTAWNGPTWRLRVQLADRPGALAKLTTRLADRNCNVLALSVLPVPGGVVDDLVVRVPVGMLPADLVAVVQANGGHCVGISRTDQHDLVDGPTAALRTAARTIGSGAGLAEALRALLGADSVNPTDIEPEQPEPEQPEAVPGEVSVTGGAHQAMIRTSDGNTLLARRGWAPFTTIELARASALAALVEKAGVPTDSPRAVLTTDGAGIVLRAGRQGDEDALAAMHTRYSTEAVAARYQNGKRSVPNRVLHRLVTPPKGRTLVAVCGTTLVAVAQMISTDKPKIAEIVLLVDEEWQQRGVGTALLRQLAATARAAGITELFALSTAGTSALARTAARAGMATSTRWEEDLMRVSVSLRPLVEEEWDRSPVRR
ncbi:MAG: GNAT family N-acetyltransferase [Sciscionella sp.]